MTTSASFAPLLQSFFTQRLMQQRQASPHTISSYRDTFRQFLKFVQQRLHKPPSRLSLEDIDAPLIVAFLDELEKHRGVSVRSRNLRLRRFTPSFVTRLSKHRLIPRRFSVYSPFLANALPAPWCTS
jgi:site-specific recombinase XerD